MQNAALFSQRAFAAIGLEVLQHKHVETGGVLLGFYRNKKWEIVESVFAGPKAIHKSAEFIYDNDYVCYEANMVSQLYDIPLEVIGIWHTHICFAPFSIADNFTNKKFAKISKNGALSFLINVSTKTSEMYQVTKTGGQSKIPFKVQGYKDESCHIVYKNFFFGT